MQRGGVGVVNVNTSIPVQFEVLKNDSDSRFISVKVWVAHVGQNLNGSYFSKDALEILKDSLANVPILGYIQVDEKNETDFKGHENTIVITEDNVEFKYQGRAYGLVPENNNAKFEIKLCNDGVEREFLTCEALMWRKFPEAIEIIERDGAKGQSMELQRDSIKGHFDKKGLFHFDSALVEGLCLLGDDYTPAMTGAIIEVFSVSNIKEQMQEMITELQLYTQGGNDVQNEFALTSQQLRDEIISILSVEKYIDKWGWEGPRYWYVDHDENFVYAHDESKGYTKIYSFSYTINGDAVTIDFDSQKRVKIVFEPFDGEDVDGSFAFVALERVEGIIEHAIAETQKKVEEEFSAKAQEAENKFNTKIEELNTQLEESQTNYTALEDEVKQLREYKEQKIAQEHNDAVDALFERFSNELTNDDVAELKEEAINMSLNDLEIALYALVGKKKATFSADTKQKKIIKPLDNAPDTPVGGKSWGHLIIKK